MTLSSIFVCLSASPVTLQQSWMWTLFPIVTDPASAVIVAPYHTAVPDPTYADKWRIVIVLIEEVIVSVSNKWI